MHLSTNIPTVHGFQCPTWEQNAEHNSLLKHIFFTPWSCKNAFQCGSASKFDHFVSCNTCPTIEGATEDSAELVKLRDTCVSQPCAVLPEVIRLRYTFARAWRLRKSEILVLADRAEERQRQARKYLTLADCAKAMLSKQQ